ncbi:MAG: acyltransferase [Ketobacteraceae bacterium]|nr:acyltransferase [Ketobacteraceae bacterium]
MKKLLAAYSIPRNFRYLMARPATNFDVVDGLRAISMLLVLMFHSYMMYAYGQPSTSVSEMVEEGGYLLSWIVNSDKGVDVFFVISGFLITSILLRQIDALGRIRLSNFYVRRFLRLSPVYYFAIFLYWWFLGGQETSNTENLWANVFYVNNFIHYKDQAMNWTWSLAIEEQFYLIFPILLTFLVLKTRHPLIWLWVLWFAAILIRYLIIMSDEQIRTLPQSQLAADEDFHAHHFSVLYDNLYTRYGALLSGCMAGYYFHYHKERMVAFFNTAAGFITKAAGLLLVAVFMLLPMVSSQFDPYQNFNIAYQSLSRNLFGLGVAIIILASFAGGWFTRTARVLLGNRVLYPVAQLSYSMYLVHVVPVAVLAGIAAKWVNDTPGVSHFDAVFAIFALATIITLILAAFMYLFIERPLMNLRK